MSYSDLNILIVDDHAFQRNALSLILAQQQIKDIHHAEDGIEAITKVKTHTPDIIICDLAMPNMDGLALLRHLAELKFIGGIILSSASERSLLRAAANLVKGFALNLLGTMSKPSSQQQLQHLFSEYRQQTITPVPAAKIKLDCQPTTLRKAIENNEFTLFVQPQVAFATGQCTGLESLIRWQHPKHGLLSPNYFLDAIEAADLMPALTLKIIAQSTAILTQLPAEFAQTKLSINISPSSLNHELVAHIITNKELQNFADQQRVSLELTEQTELLSDTASLELLSRLRMNGFNLSVDDFGTGYSSLQQLSQYPFNEIKLDRSFVSQALADPQSEAICDMSIQLAKKLHMNVVVEGIESEKQWHHMARLGADICQGFFAAKPMPAQELSNWLAHWQRHYNAFSACN